MRAGCRTPSRASTSRTGISGALAATRSPRAADARIAVLRGSAMKPSIVAKLDQLSRRLTELDGLLASEGAARDMDEYRKLSARARRARNRGRAVQAVRIGARRRRRSRGDARRPGDEVPRRGRDPRREGAARSTRGSSCSACCCRGTRTTSATSSSRSAPAPAATSRRSSPAISSGCTRATPSASAGRSRSSRRARPNSAATRR